MKGWRCFCKAVTCAVVSRVPWSPGCVEPCSRARAVQSSRAEEQLQEPGQRCREWPRSVSHCASATPVPGQRVLTQLRALHGVGPAARGPAGLLDTDTALLSPPCPRETQGTWLVARGCGTSLGRSGSSGTRRLGLRRGWQLPPQF